MSRFNNNRGGLGMNNFQPRRGGGPGGPMRGGLMGNPNFRNHPFQNQNQNRRGPNNNFNRPPNQGPQTTPQKPQQNPMPIIPPPSPGPALTMKGPMQQQQKQAQQQQEPEQRKPTTPAAQPKIPSPPPKPNMTSPQPTQANKNQTENQQVGNANGQQQKQPPQASPKPGPQQGQKPGPQLSQRTGPPNRGGQIHPKQEPERKATDSNAAETDSSQPKVCFIICKTFSVVNGVDGRVAIVSLFRAANGTLDLPCSEAMAGGVIVRLLP